MKQALTYDDVLLVPQYSDIKSRKEVEIRNNLDKHIRLALPIISSPMDTVTESDMSIAMCNAGGLGIIHRYNTVKEQCDLVRKCAYAGAAIGVTGDYLKRAINLFDVGVKVLCIDVAHGHHILMKEAIAAIREELGDMIHIMAGNVATLQGFNDLSDWGADSIRCNIGGGSICSTRIQTGHGLPGLQTIMDCARSDRDTKIIADGGIRSSGDIVKALAAGADFVMLGSMLAGTEESPGKKMYTLGGIRKEYRGMASKDAQMDWKGQYSSDEGICTSVDYKGPVDSILKDLRRGIVSGLSYSGARTIEELQSKAVWTSQTNAGLLEGRTHILGAN